MAAVIVTVNDTAVLRSRWVKGGYPELCASNVLPFTTKGKANIKLAFPNF